MLGIFASPMSFFVSLLLFTIGAIGSLIAQKDDALANWWGGLFAIAGSLGGLIFATSAMIVGNSMSFSLGALTFPLLTFSFHVDMLSAFFVFVISLIALFCSFYGIGYVKHYYKKYSIGALGFFYNLFILGMMLVVSSSNGLFFLIAWEVMSVASYFLVIYDRKEQSNLKAGFLYLVMTHIGTVFIILAFLLFYTYTGSLDFEVIKSGVALIPLSIKNIIFVLAVIGFGTKAGIIPFHVWLPSAHPAAPSHVSGLMSGVMIKTGIYMMMRIFLDILQPIPTWWGLTLLIIGSVSALLGVLYALAEYDIKRLLAYSSIENIGIILLGLGSALTFSSFGMPQLALLSLVASLFHTLNHSIFKSLLFLGAGSVINETHTRNMEEYGGLIQYMPQTAFFFLVGSMAISALPPFNGFFSEWMTFQSLFQGIAALDFSARWIFVTSAGALAFTGGLALACFVKAFGVTFLARPRSQEVLHAKESLPLLRVGMGALAILLLVFGLFSGFVVSFIEKVGRNLSIFHSIPSFVSVLPNQSPTIANFLRVSGPTFFAFIIVACIAVALAIKYVIHRNQEIRLGATWDCGTDLTPRMEISATGFVYSLMTIYKGVLMSRIHHDVKYFDEKTGFLQKSRTVTLSAKDVYQLYLYGPLRKLAAISSEKVKNIQSGNIHTYIVYIFFALVVALVFAL
ncbi:MAG: proton-conducting transporter membrane subunit [bacterium]|nr:proton-conducting transporter membrane subunit [bacterium]